MFVRHTSALVAGALLSGCATLVSGTTQAIKIDSVPQGARVYTAVKSEKNGHPVYGSRSEAGVTPITVLVQRKDGVVFVESPGYEPVEVPMQRGVNPWIIGDVLLTSLLSTSIDTSTGAAKRYDPDEYLIELRAMNP
jgi:hypothetical protein